MTVYKKTKQPSLENDACFHFDAEMFGNSAADGVPVILRRYSTAYKEGNTITEVHTDGHFVVACLRLGPLPLCGL